MRLVAFFALLLLTGCLGGAHRPMAMDDLDPAYAAARIWNPNAVLVTVASHRDTVGHPERPLDGRSDNWTYIFWDKEAGPTERTGRYVVTVGGGSVLSAGATPALIPPTAPIKPITLAPRLTSVEAVQASGKSANPASWMVYLSYSQYADRLIWTVWSSEGANEGTLMVDDTDGHVYTAAQWPSFVNGLREARMGS